jgi:hypothetical protein
VRGFEPDVRIKGVDFIMSGIYPGWTDGPVGGYAAKLQSDKFMYGQAGDFVLSYGCGAAPGSRGGINLKGTEASQAYNLGAMEDALAGTPGVAGRFVDSFADYEGPAVDPRGAGNTALTGLLTADRGPKLAYERYAGIETGVEWLKRARLPFRVPGVDLAAFVLLLIAGFAIWSGFSKTWPAFIEPDLLGPVSDEGRTILRNFLLFGLPMLLIAGAAASFSAASLMDMYPADLMRAPLSAARAANVFLKPFPVRIATLAIMQAAAFFLGAILLSFVYGGEPLVLFELLTRCTALRMLLIAIPFFPVSPWFVIALAAGWETYMQGGALSRVYGVSAGSAAAVMAGLHTLVISLALAGALAVFGSIGFLF